jgi:hypothetical protein
MAISSYMLSTHKTMSRVKSPTLLNRLVLITVCLSSLSCLYGLSVSSVMASTAISNTIKTNTTLSGGGSGLVGHWTFDGKDTLANIADVSGNYATGSLILGSTGNTATTTVAGRLGQAMVFDGVSDYVDMGDRASLEVEGSLPFTISTWFKPKIVIGTDTYHILVAKGVGGSAGYGFQYENESGVYKLDLVKYGVAAQPITSVTYYINGVSAGTASNASAYIASGANAFRIGSQSNSTFFTNGSLDDVRIYNRALSAGEVKRLYSLGATTKIAKPLTVRGAAQAGSPGTLANNLVLYYTYDPANMTPKITDSSVNGYHAHFANVNPVTGPSATSTLTTSGHVGTAVVFSNSTQDYAASNSDIDSIDLASAGDKITVSSWLKRNAADVGLQEVITKYRYDGGAFDNKGWLIRFSANKIKWHLSPSDDEWTSTDTYTDLDWHLWTVTFVAGSGSSIHVYRDGVEIAGSWTNGTGNSIPGAGIARVTLASYDIGDANCSCSLTTIFNGAIDETRIYNRVLSETEIRNLYQLGATTFVNKTPSTNPDLKRGLVGHWTFDGPNLLQNVQDISSSYATGSLILGSTGSTATTTVSGRLGQALKFDGVSDYIVARDPSLLNNTSIFAWIRPNANLWGAIFDTKPSAIGAIRIWRVGSDRINYVIGGDDPTSAYYPTSANWTGQWHHVGITTSGSGSPWTIRLYIDGVAVASHTTTMQPSSSIFNIGRYNNGDYFSGTIDDTRIYNRTLSAGEVKRLYELGK